MTFIRNRLVFASNENFKNLYLNIFKVCNIWRKKPLKFDYNEMKVRDIENVVDLKKLQKKNQRNN